MDYIQIRILLSYPNILAYIRSMTELQQQEEPHLDSRTAINYYLRVVLVFKVSTAPVQVLPQSMQKSKIVVLCWR